MNVSAIILAAGKSTRMGKPKLLLPWGETTVLGRVIATLQSAGIEDVVIVTGEFREQVEKIAAQHGARVTQNNHTGEMITSIQAGLLAQTTSEAALIALGDQPQMQKTTVLKVLQAWQSKSGEIIMPSYQMRRGHPWMISQKYWGEILAMNQDQTMREFFSCHKNDVFYVNVETDSILQDLDTPEDYLKFKPSKI